MVSRASALVLAAMSTDAIAQNVALESCGKRLPEGLKMARLQRSWVSAILAATVVAAIELAAPEPALGTAVCPPPPNTLAGLIAADAVETGPLTEQFRPVYGVYAEAAAGCWGGAEITVAGFVASPEGLGGVSAFSIEPAWIVSRAHFLSATDSIDPQAGPVGPFLPVAVPPSLEAEFTSLDGRWVRASGHFDDQAATTCVVASSSPDVGAVPSAEQAIDICRTSFVLTAVGPLTPPPTDSETIEGPGGGISGWAGLVVAVAAGVSFALALPRRRPAHSRPDRRL